MTPKNDSIDHRRQEVQQIINNVCDLLNQDGVNARDYVEQIAWLFFLKAFDETENRREEECAFGGEDTYERRLTGKFAWSNWSQKTDKPDAMLKFVSTRLWDKLTLIQPGKGMGTDALAQRFQRIFSTVKNHCRKGATFARVVQQINRLHFADNTDVIVLSEIYESLLKRVAADSAGYAGEFYTQRHIIRAMIEVVKPSIRDRIYDPCFGSAGFLAECVDFIRKGATLSATQLDKLQNKTFYGVELKPLTYLLGTMNMILHGIEGANLELGNTLERHSTNVPESEKYEVILANPPYGGKMDPKLQTNFKVRSAATECLFLQHIMKNLAKGGRAAVVVPEGVLFRTGPDQAVRKELIENFRMLCVLSLPAGVFLPYTGVKTNVIFFERPKDGSSTQKVWFYELENDGFELKQTRRPIAGSQLPDFLKKFSKQAQGENNWTLDRLQIEKQGYDLSARNPHRKIEEPHKPALELVRSVRVREKRILELLDELEGLLGGGKK
ncbi:MAG TPA: N-6 DNA methylase [Fibrobacteraceae bacterium]|nr:N-6 DNA methylase [Fibrobacteraceae bacterium]